MCWSLSAINEYRERHIVGVDLACCSIVPAEILVDPPDRHDA